MDKKLFSELVESMTQMNEIARGERAPSREFHVEPLAIKELRSTLGLSQPKFAALLHVDVGTLRNWEQGRREPTRKLCRLAHLEHALVPRHVNYET